MKKYKLDIALFLGSICPEFPVTEVISIEVEFNDEEVAKIRQLVKDSTGDKGAGLMAILKNDASELHERISKAIFQKIFVFYLFYGLRYDGFMLDEADRRRNFKKDLESGVFCPKEYIDYSMYYDEVPTDENELFNLWEEWERDQFGSRDVDWALARYPDLSDHMDLKDNQYYFCHIPEEFKS